MGSWFERVQSIMVGQAQYWDYLGHGCWLCDFLRSQSQKQSLEQEAGLSGLIFKGLPPSDCFLQLSPTP